jgi:SAM-dependent methyltransferase
MKLDFPATQRNRGPILEVLTTLIHDGDSVLELASGSGQHAVYFANELPIGFWQPTDIESDNLKSIDAYCSDMQNVGRALSFDVSSKNETIGEFDCLYCANLIHISPWECTEGVFRAASQNLRKGGLLIFYGPFRESNIAIADSNLSFERMLQSNDKRFGLRHLDQVDSLGQSHHFTRTARYEMPSNNILVVYKNQA